MANSLLAVEPNDRDRFLDLCLKRRVRCSNARFQGPFAVFHWRNEVTENIRDRFWNTYKCVYLRNLTQCPVDGDWSTWSPWNPCSATCDAMGNQTRKRTCNNPVPLRGGARCQGSLVRSRPCLGDCADVSINGSMPKAEAFLQQVHEAYPELKHDCFDAHCTFGVAQRVISEKRTMTKYWSTLSCVKYGGACPVDGNWGPWNPWSHCSLNCGSGSRSRSRSCNNPPPAFAGHPCRGEFHEQQSCVMRDCGPTSTETFTEWTEWTPCSVSCGNYGVQTSTRVCLRHAGCDLSGVLTPRINRSRPCLPGGCPKQGGWSEWSEWAPCSAACGTGRHSRMRLCDSPYPAGGLYCMGDAIKFRLCSGENCAGHPRPPKPSLLAIGSNTLVVWKKPEEDEVVQIAKNDEYQSGALNPALEGLYTLWSAWTRCSTSCGRGRRSRYRWCSSKTTPLPPCEGEIRQVQSCNAFVCPVSGGWGVWLPWTPCSKTCGSGKRQRYRECSNPLPLFGGSCVGDAKGTEYCELQPCPRLSGGTWSKWSPWTPCSVSCGGGVRSRQRARQRFAGPPNGTVTSLAVPPGRDKGNQETLDCNTQPCPVDGSWAEWAEWSRCSALCGLGMRLRDRTCTDPSPVFGGRVCWGPGTDLIHCFSGPCKDAEDRAVYLGRTSWIHFMPRNRPSRFLLIYIHFKPMTPVGSVLRRYRQCHSVFDDNVKDDEDAVAEGEDRKNKEKDVRADQDGKCQLLVDLYLEQAEPRLTVQARGASLNITSPVILSLGSWHEILVEVLKTGASMRVNDHARMYANFSRQLVQDLDFDSHMVIGTSDNNSVGMAGSISSLSINFRTQDLFSSSDWEGQGTPVGRHAVSLQSINPSVQLPHFRGLYYSPLRLYHKERLSVRMTMALDKGEGLVLYTRGQAEGTHVTLGIKRTRLVLCMLCARGGGNVCHHGDLLTLHQWYHVSLAVDGNEAELRVDQGKALQLACKGMPFRPRKALFVGGRSFTKWEEVKRSTNYTVGFFGVLGTLVVNGRTVPFRRAVLMGRDERINPDGYSRATRITPVFEHITSIVTLRCEVEKPPDPETEIKVIWLIRDTVLEPSDNVDIVKPVGSDKLVGTLELQPGAHTEGIYACVVSLDGRLELRHVFPVFRHAKKKAMYEGDVEWLFMYLLLVLIALLALGLVAYKFRHLKEPEKEPLLPTEPMEMFLPMTPHLHGSDSETSWQNYLSQNQGNAQKIDVVSFGPTSARKLSMTPGVSSQRPLAVSELGQVKLGEDPRVTSANRSTDETANLFRVMGGSVPVDATFNARPKMHANDLRVNLSHNRSSTASMVHQDSSSSSADNVNATEQGEQSTLTRSPILKQNWHRRESKTNRYSDPSASKDIRGPSEHSDQSLQKPNKGKTKQPRVSKTVYWSSSGEAVDPPASRARVQSQRIFELFQNRDRRHAHGVMNKTLNAEIPLKKLPRKQRKRSCKEPLQKRCKSSAGEYSTSKPIATSAYDGRRLSQVPMVIQYKHSVPVLRKQLVKKHSAVSEVSPTDSRRPSLNFRTSPIGDNFAHSVPTRNLRHSPAGFGMSVLQKHPILEDISTGTQRGFIGVTGRHVNEKPFAKEHPSIDLRQTSGGSKKCLNGQPGPNGSKTGLYRRPSLQSKTYHQRRNSDTQDKDFRWRSGDSSRKGTQSPGQKPSAEYPWRVRGRAGSLPPSCLLRRRSSPDGFYRRNSFPDNKQDGAAWSHLLRRFSLPCSSVPAGILRVKLPEPVVYAKPKTRQRTDARR